MICSVLSLGVLCQRKARLIVTRSPFNVVSPVSPKPISCQKRRIYKSALKARPRAMRLALSVEADKVRCFLFDQEPKASPTKQQHPNTDLRSSEPIDPSKYRTTTLVAARTYPSRESELGRLSWPTTNTMSGQVSRSGQLARRGTFTRELV